MLYLSSFAFLIILQLINTIRAEPVGSCEPNRRTPQFLRDTSNQCVYYQCIYQGTPLLRPTKLTCPTFNRVPTGYGKIPRYPDNSFPCTIYSRKTRLCDVDNPEWSQWQPWGRCSKTCGSGVQYRTRSCLGGSSCRGDLLERRDCMIKQC